ncbi:ABC transporter permease subunit [Roseococcus pinisoli]|uniref:ABC transporter permease subunit n=1 Tax=Roseococcus pinisoli TaxID=2835040 RepID=A0ABS5QFG8_9PROT|nr:ABC transporter permease subunit [Roseococcus pinisoli]MBS7812051.1 ABC transporter permease subunit [Roseococcus pinisoli]
MSGQAIAAPVAIRPARPSPRFTWKLSRLRRLVVPILLVALWQIAANTGLISTRLLAPPNAIAAAAWELIVSGELPYHLLISLQRVAIGLAIALSAGVSLGLIAGLSRLGEDAVDATLQMLRALPFLALVPLFILWLGIGEATKIALVALGATFPIYLTLFGGIRGVDPKLIEAGRIFGLDRWGLIRHVVLPGALPQALVGLRYALGTAWLSLVVGEQINATAGIGFLVMDAREFLRTDIILVGLLVYALLGLGADQLVRVLERRALAWRPSLIREA